MTAAITELAPVSAQLAEDSASFEVDWSKVKGIEFREALHERDERVADLQGMQLDLSGDFEHIFAAVHAEGVLRQKLSALRNALSDQNLELLPEYEGRIGVLQDLGFIDAGSTVLLKGRVACEINTAHEVILTELILENVLSQYEPEEVVALLSAFVFTEKTDDEPILTPRLLEGKKALIDIAERVAVAQAKRRTDSTDAFTGLRFGLAEVVYEWARGMPFAQVAELTDVPEGTIVRVISRLDETCREVRDAARVIGDATLYQRMEHVRDLIRRDVIFASSLYV